MLVDGSALVINLLKRVLLCEFKFRKAVLDIKFSPDGQYIAVTHGSQVQVWKYVTAFSIE
jgi:periodic tryptophan protein 2